MATANSMKVLFLDIDGVLTSEESLALYGGNQMFDKGCLAQVNRIIDATDACIVISSNWREGNPLWVMQDAMSKRGITGRVIDMTPDLKRLEGMKEDRGQLRVRGIEIQRWLTANPWVTRYAIVDDLEVVGHESFFRTNVKFGLTEQIADEVIKSLLS